MHDPNTICPRHTDGRGIKKKKNGRGSGGGAAEVSDFFYKESKSTKKFFRVASEGATRVSE